MSQSNIKVNITDIHGNRTSTTINYTVAEFYHEHVLGRDAHIGECVRDFIADDINDLIKEHNLNSKESIERCLLYKILNCRFQ